MKCYKTSRSSYFLLLTKLSHTLTLPPRQQHMQGRSFSATMYTPRYTEVLANRGKNSGAIQWHSSSADVVFNVPTQLLAGCLSNCDGSWPFFSSLQTTWPLRCLWLCIIHWWCPSHEPLRLCIQTLTHLTARQQTDRLQSKQGGWKCQHQANSDR